MFVGGGDGELYVYELELRREGCERLELRARLPIGAMPSFFCFMRARPMFYAVNEHADALVSGRVGAGRFAAELLDRVACPGGPAYLALDRSERFVFSANYTDGSVGVFAVSADGTLLPRQRVETGTETHAAVADPTNRWVLVANKGTDSVRCLRFDAEAGRLSEQGSSELSTPTGSGPRHLAFSASGRSVYVIHENQSTLGVARFDARRGELETVQVVSTLPADGARSANTGADLHLHPSGRYLFASNRGHNSLARFAVDPSSGLVELLGHEATSGSTPRNFALDDEGRYLLVANQGSGTIAGFAIDSSSGALRRLFLVEVGTAVYWVGFAPDAPAGGAE